MFMNPTQAYHDILMDIFLEAIIKDKESKYYQKSKLEVIEAVLNNMIEFKIDENGIVYERYPNNGKEETAIFTKDHKNDEVNYCLKILLSGYPSNDENDPEE